MKVHTTKFFTITILSLLAFVMTSSVCSAQEWSRNGKGQVFGIFQTMGGDSTTVGGGPQVNTLDDTTVYGLGIGADITDHWNVNMDLLFGSVDEVATHPTLLGYTKEHNIWLWDINVDYNIMKDRLTPVLSAGIGLINFSEWEESDFSYNLGAGARYDISDNFFIKAMYRITWTKMEDTDDALQLDGFSVSIGYMF